MILKSDEDPHQNTSLEKEIIDLRARLKALQEAHTPAADKKPLRLPAGDVLNFYENTHLPVFLTNTRHEIVYANPRFLNLMSCADVTSLPDLSPDLLAFLQAIQADGAVQECQVHLMTGSGDPISVIASGTARLDETGNFAGTQVMLSDTTPKGVSAPADDADDAQNEGEQRYRELFEGIDDAIIVHDEHANILDVNEAACQRLGYSRDEFLRMKVTDIDTPEYAQGFPERIHQQLEKGGLSQIQVVHRTRDGHNIDADVNTRRIIYRGQTAILAVIRDVTELRQSEQKYRELYITIDRQRQELELLDRVRVILARQLDMPTVFRTVVEAIAETFGYALVSIYLRQGDELILQHDVGYQKKLPIIPITAGVCGRVARQGKPELILNVANDSDFLEVIGNTLSEICVPLFDDADEVVGVLNVETTGDVVLTEADLALMTALSSHINTALRRARYFSEMRESEARNRALLDAIPDMIIRHDRAGNYLDIRPSLDFEPLFSLEDSIGSNIHAVLPPYYARMRHEYIKKALDSGEVQLFDYPIEVNGVPYHHEARVVPDDNNEVLIFIRDVTERKAAEKHTLELAVERERMRLLGQFISDVSHDFRTPLSTINTGLYLLGKTPDADKQKERLGMIQHQVNHLSQMIDSMLTLVRLESNPNFDFRPLNYNQIVRDVAASMNSALTRKELTLVCDLNPDLPPVLADRADWGKLLMELMKNAIQYTSAPGTVTVRTCQEGDFVVIEIEDTGSGIAEAEIDLIFERFYRTDKARRAETGGAGLGLAIVKKIVEVHQGWIEVRSQPGTGSTFRVGLPEHHQPVEKG